MQNLPDPIGFKDALNKFEAFLKSQKRSSATTIAYHSDLTQLQKHLDGKRITQATTVATEHLSDYISSLTSLNYTSKSISRKINSLKTFFKFLHQEKIVYTNPSTPLVHPKVDSKPPRILTSPEIKSVREAARLDIRISAVIELLLQTGMRISELAGLHLEDVKKNELYIRAQESNSARSIPLNHPASSSLNNYLAIRPKVLDTHLFVTKTGHRLLIRNIRTAIDRYFKKAGLKDAKINDLRHSFIGHQLIAGVTAETINKHIGHRRLSSTQKYLDHITIEVTETTTRLIEL